MVKNKRNTHTDLYDLCSCYEPLEMPPEGTFDTFKEPEPTLENTSFYATEEDGKLYFYCGKTKIEVIEHFADNGKALNTLVEDVITYTAHKDVKSSRLN